ncbi:hypothetical protein [Kordia zhangzhouensis]|uniref:hypothetical protein n=1 Tax=Kordia zhangzhouensis TaxID=1620405 RepID=UPI0012E0157E|nr:hypothetical protein [Kordia zhangzhouensis]
MKKIFLVFLVSSLFIACNVDSIESDLIPANGNSNPQNSACIIDTNNPPAFQGTLWNRTGFFIDSTIDGNNDGVYSANLMTETTLGQHIIQFSNDFSVENFTHVTLGFNVVSDGNGGLMQAIHSGGNIDGPALRYIQDGDTINFCLNGQVFYSGTLSNNETVLTIELPREQIFFSLITTRILREDDSIEEYQGGATLVYEIQ